MKDECPLSALKSSIASSKTSLEGRRLLAPVVLRPAVVVVDDPGDERGEGADVVGGHGEAGHLPGARRARWHKAASAVYARI